MNLPPCSGFFVESRIHYHRTLKMISIWYITIFLFPSFLRLSSAQSPYYSCPSSALSYNTNSSFERNLNALLASLAAKSSVGFYNTTVGQSPEQVHGLVQCHGDISADDCRSCAASAASQIVQVCPGKRMAVIWFDECLLRYSSFNFFGVVDASKLALVNTVSMPNPARFKPIVQFLFDNLIKSATTNISGHMYATDSVKYTDNVTLYCLAECTRDLSFNFCNSCLKSSVRAISQCCSDKQGARILSGSCVIRYEIYPFFGNLSTALVTLPPPLSPSSTSGGAPTNSSVVVTGCNRCLCSISRDAVVIAASVSATTSLLVSAICYVLLSRKNRIIEDRRLLQQSSSKSHLIASE